MSTFDASFSAFIPQNQEPAKLTYFRGKGRAEAVRWALAACDVPFEHVILETPADLNNLRNEGKLLFNQVPLLEIDGLNLVQSSAIIDYVGNTRAPNLMGETPEMKVKIDMIRETSKDMAGPGMGWIWMKSNGSDWQTAFKTTFNKYLPLLERCIENNSDSDMFTVGASMTMGDVLMAQSLWNYQDILGGIEFMKDYPRVTAMCSYVWSYPSIKAFRTAICTIPHPTRHT